MKTLNTLFLLLVLCQLAAAQEDRQGLFLDAFPTQDSLILRWATNDPATFEAGRTHGYLLQKATANDERFVTLRTIRPYSEASIQEKLLQHPEDEAAQIAAHVLQDQLVTPHEGDVGLTEAFDHHNNIMVALNFVMLSADISALAGDLLGLRYVVRDFPANEKAIYRIIGLDAEASGVDTAYYYFNGTLGSLPPVQQLAFEQNHSRLQLKWSYADYSSIYTAYDIFRAEDRDAPYQKLNNSPIYTASGEAEHHFFLDTVQKSTQYYYRIQGYSPFGIKGPMSTEFSHYAKDQVVGYEAINIKAEGNHEQINIRWEAQQEAGTVDQVKGLRVFKANSEAGVYQALHPGYLPTNTLSFTDTVIRDERMHYYRVVAYNQDEFEQSSSVILANYIDTLAPAPPSGLYGYIDSSGIARIIWRPNAERDLDGYRVYTSNRPDGTYYHAHDLLHHSNEFVDTVGLKFLTKEVYYKVAAVDFNNNHSDYSTLLILERPDTIAPVAPKIIKYQKSGNQITLQISPSSSEDVVRTYLLRSCLNKTDTIRLTQGSRSYTDSLFSHLHGNIQYQVFAVDQAGNQRGGNVVELAHQRSEASSLALTLVEENQAYILLLQHELSAGDALYLYLESADQPLQFLDRLDHQSTDYTLPRSTPNSFRVAAYVIHHSGRKSPTFFSNQITRS